MRLTGEELEQARDEFTIFVAPTYRKLKNPNAPDRPFVSCRPEAVESPASWARVYGRRLLDTIRSLEAELAER